MQQSHDHTAPPSLSRRPRWLLASGLLLAALGAVSLLALITWKRRLDAHYWEGYDPTAPRTVILEEDVLAPPAYEQIFTIEGPHDAIPCTLLLPLQHQNPVPCIVFLHGINQSRRFASVIAPAFVEAGFALASFDQLMCGRRRIKHAGLLQQIARFRRRPAATVNDTRRLIDILQARPDIDPGAIYLLGASYGAIAGASAAAFDNRIQAAVFVYGGADLRLLLDSRAARQELGPAFWPAYGLARWLLQPADPIYTAGAIAPRPLFMQNGQRDSLIPHAAAQALYDAARPPKQLRWYEGDHIGLDEATLRRVLDDALQWIAQHHQKGTKE